MAAILGSGAVWYLVFRNKAANDQLTPPPQANSIEQPRPTIVRLIAGGDILPHETVNNQAKTAASYDYQQFFSEVEPYFKKADIRFCNQEALSSGEQFGVSGYPAFNAPIKFAQDLSAVGCNLISLANNHLNDKGQAAINKTLEVWDGLKPLAHSGANRSAAEQAAVRYFDLKGIKFAFLAYTDSSNVSPKSAYAVNLLRQDLVRDQLTEARASADVVIVSAHWGSEYSSEINASQEAWAQTFADLGADVVIGTGPHVLQPVKRLPRAGGGETLVWYSLGNLLSTQLETESLIGGLAVMDFDVSTKKLTQTRFLPTYMHYEWTPQQKAADDLLARKNLKIYPLDQAETPLALSLNQTTVQAQTSRVEQLLNSFTQIPVITSTEY